MDQATISKIRDFYNPTWEDDHISFQSRRIPPLVLRNWFLTYGQHYSNAIEAVLMDCQRVDFYELAQLFPEDFESIKNFSFPTDEVFHFLRSAIKATGFITVVTLQEKPKLLLAIEQETKETFFGIVGSSVRSDTIMDTEIWAYGVYHVNIDTDWYTTYLFRNKPSLVDIETILAIDEMDDYLGLEWNRTNKYIQKDYLNSIPSEHAIHAQKALKEDRNFRWTEFPGNVAEKWKLFKLYLDHGIL
ncbi:hypothetical protein ACIFOE_25735 [Paenibacillus sp. NRS-1783]|uniref:hypothetical protein n=1 Tax=Paenibacillus sp. NRS-1783 TaxID=3233907 RepID=UPI003D2895EF